MSVAESFSLIPLRWPAEWHDPSVLDAIHKTPINALLTGPTTPLPGPVAERAQALGFRVCDDAHLPEGVKAVDGVWPGLRLSRNSRAVADAGPTGAPWIDSNAWRIQLERTLTRQKTVWIRSKPPKRVILPTEIPVAIADAAMAGGRWIISVPPDFQAWGAVSDTLQFFAAHAEWRAMPTKAVLGVLSTFKGDYSSMAFEVLNLTSRMQQPYRILLPDTPIPELRAIIYIDAPPAPALRTKLLDWVRRGGLLVVNDVWPLEESAPAASGKAGERGSGAESHPRFQVHTLGQGRVAIPKEAAQDPFEYSADAQVILSHRYDPVSFWNASVCGTHLAAGPHGSALLELVNYTGSGKGTLITARVRGEYRRADLLEPGKAPRTLPIKAIVQAAEIDLPEFNWCAALELS